MNSWNLGDLKAELNSRQKTLKGWTISREILHRRERYFVNDGSTEKPRLGIDQDREVNTQSWFVKLFVPGSAAGRQGEVTKQLFPSLPLSVQLESAIQAARTTDGQSWELPEALPEDRIPEIQTTDVSVAENLERATEALTTEIRDLVGAPKAGSEFNSAELFVSLHERELFLSNGLSHRTAQTRIYSEAAYSTATDEFLAARWSVGSKNLELQDLFRNGERAARETLKTQTPASGTYWILIDADVLGQIFSQVASQLSGANAYLGLPFKKPGDALISDVVGDPLTLSLDPTLSLGADSLAINDQGVLQKPLTLVDRGVVRASMISKQYADYLGNPPTTTRGNFIVPAGTKTHAELLTLHPRVIEIVQFSALFGDPNTGTFSSEIKLGRLHENGKTTPIKGGSVSINFFENFRQAYFSKETVRRAHFEPAPHFGLGGGREYFGPQFALIGGVQVAS